MAVTGEINVKTARRNLLGTNRARGSSHARAGLSMLELALALPLLLFIMALIINFGTVAAWKVRDLTVARLAVWESRWPRTGSSNPVPAYWPKAGVSTTNGPTNVPELDDGRVDQPVARGPLQGATVDSDLLDPTRGLREGSAQLTRDFPLLAKMGPYRLEGNNRLLDDKWQYQRTHLSGNVQRRVPVLYQLAKAPASMVAAFVRAVTAVIQAPFREQLRPLDNDEEFIYYGQMFGWGGPPSFYPNFMRFCSLNQEEADDHVKMLIDQIQGVPQRMAASFIQLYDNVINRYKAMLAAKPPPSASEIARLQAEIKRLQKNKDILQEFLNKL